MKKIMFSKKYGLEQAVLDGRKTMTRRILPLRIANRIDFKAYMEGDNECAGEFDNGWVDWRLLMPYQVGEIVAVAQSYKTIYDTMEEQEGNCKANEWWCKAYDVIDNQFGPATTPGYRNKMFVLADLMPNRIKITDAKLELLQDISDEDCLKEGVFYYEQPPLYHEYDRYAPWPPYVKPYKHNIDNLKYFCNPRAAFAHLIDKMNGSGTWNNNPLVVAYTQQLMKE